MRAALCYIAPRKKYEHETDSMLIAGVCIVLIRWETFYNVEEYVTEQRYIYVIVVSEEFINLTLQY